MNNELKRIAKKIVNTYTPQQQHVRLRDIPTSISMPQGEYYNQVQLRDLLKQYTRMQINKQQPWNDYYGSPNYRVAIPEWLRRHVNYWGDDSQITPEVTPKTYAQDRAKYGVGKAKGPYGGWTRELFEYYK